ncbi:DNA adenine methylase [Cyanobacterium aponinum UTEX 3221]|uniref:DNA adenine methylase n=1 Tax=Cyanobacterium aponinum TaxID=379064 RepID=UPI002B4C0A0A|nr:DNA adenine methylase [Cyanobacterium aponinum]WRL39542.1 DNA adenine methylase [Cyanobacterium aponinum UTEX 3221]
MNKSKAKPFLKWAGGKTQLLEIITSNFPYKNEDEFIYVEPFVGSGAVLFWILNNYQNIKKAIINDINLDLINAYKIIKKNVEDLIFILEKWQNEYYSLEHDQENKKKYFYEKRDLFNQRKSNQIKHTALFIFLNKTCFNGLYRVNKNNLFNVPIGSYRKPVICDKNNLRLVSNSLKKVEIIHGDFEKTLRYAENKSLFYLDPPYKPLNKTSNFNSYADQKFNDTEQIRLKKFCDKLDQLGCKWILSNSDVREANSENIFFDDLYKKYQIHRVLARRNINSNGLKRGLLNELLITNNRK